MAISQSSTSAQIFTGPGRIFSVTLSAGGDTAVGAIADKIGGGGNNILPMRAASGVFSSDVPLPGYYLSDIAVSGVTTVTYGDYSDRYTGESVPATITDARAIIIQKADKRVYQVSVSNTEIILNKSASGAADNGLVDLFVLSDPAANFYIKSGVAVTSTSFAGVAFSTLGTDDLGQTVPTTIDPAPRIFMIDQVDKMGILGAVTTTSVQLKKSSAGATTNASVVLFILKSNSAIYQDADESVANIVPAEIRFSDMSDSGTPLPSELYGVSVFVTPKNDRHVWTGNITINGVEIARSAAGAEAAKVDINVWTLPDAPIPPATDRAVYYRGLPFLDGAYLTVVSGTSPVFAIEWKPTKG